MKKFAFTLSEVLIVLAVLGVIAAMTIPDLIQDAKEKSMITALKKSYTVFSQAVDMAIAENGPVNTWDIDSEFKLYNILKPYLRISNDCGTSNGCFASHYEALFNENYAYQPDRLFVKGELVSGVSFFVWTGGTGCAKECGSIGVDVNGKSGPNKAGVDFFEFNITVSDGLIPRGQKIKDRCTYNDTSANNGVGCTYWAIKHENMDYLRKSGYYYSR